MKLRALLIASLATFLGAQGPACAWSCLAHTATAAKQAHDGAPPCHGEDEHAPTGENASHAFCGCAGMAGAVLAGAGPPARNLAAMFPLAGAAVAPPRRAELGPISVLERDLPPPDILLLKSTLLI